MRLVPPVRHPDHPPWRVCALQQGEQLPAGDRRAFGNHPHPAVFEVLRPAREAELEGPRPRPPPEANALNPAFHPRGKPSLPTRGHSRARGRGWHFGQL